MLPTDPTADRARRAWLACPGCDHGAGCGECANQRNCADHWQYLLSNRATVVHLQCPTCGHLWSTDTRHRKRRGAA
ncbi:hypothetical protein [Mycobacterium sp. 852002-51961_SCH5331710]|uniref:hypothetical protein n=1 Tax=Mycobacterium sp. 852002-51961_SCH5331710 TaxID=1834105 RepID=UPI0007FEF773|nr:hypothetical protein [Mycobacterium sp. 852002-51961_SCH5331710]OBB42803.1 hypothetical protein A5752_06765 [Mycobacterium sp. 852002-51961_SCH5331710]